MPKKVTDLPALTTPAGNDILLITDISDNTTKQITRQDLLNNAIDTVDVKDKSITPAKLSIAFTGVVTQYAGSTAPTGWLICDGTAVSRTTYADLFGVIGTLYGTGDSLTTFNIPNLKGKVAVGRDTSDVQFDGMGETGGAKTHTLTATEMPAHDHGGRVGGTSNGDYIGLQGGGQGGWGLAQDGANNNIYRMTIPSQGGGAAHNNLQPYVVLNYIIKT